MQNKGFIDILFKLLLSSVMSFSLLYPITTTLQFSYSALEIFLPVLIITCLFTGLFVPKKISRWSSYIFPVSLIVFVIYSFIKDRFSYYIELLRWLSEYINGKLPLDTDFQFGFTLVLCLAISFIVFVFTIIRFNFIVIFTGSVSLYVSQWIFNYFVKEAYLSFYIFVAAIIVYYLVHIYSRNSSQDSNDYTSSWTFILFSLPICAIVLLLANSIPASPKPIEWKWMDDRINSLYLDITTGSFFSKFGSSPYFSLNSTGFGRNGTLGGDVSLNSTKVLEVTTRNKVYLKGRTMDRYNGNSWSDTLKGKFSMDDLENPINIGIKELYNGVPLLLSTYVSIDGSDYIARWDYTQIHPDFAYEEDVYNDTRLNDEIIIVNGENININVMPGPVEPYSGKFSLIDFDSQAPEYFNITSPYIYLNEVNVKFANIKTASIFHPSMVESIQEGNIQKKLVYGTKSGDLIYSQPLRKDSSYKINAYNIRYENERYQELARESFNGLYDVNISFMSKTIYNLIYNMCLKEYTDRYNIWYDESRNELINIIENVDNSGQISDSVTSYLDNHQLSSLIKYSQLSLLKDKIRNCVANINMEYLETFDTIIELRNNARNIRKTYSSIPSDIPQRVLDLATYITQDYDNDYDKAKAIEEYLLGNFKYSLKPGNTPSNRDFVDYFLFDLKKGYCTYFASSMAILTRAAGIPSRYVEGFILPPVTSTNDVYNVTNAQAHAWAEVYLEGIGWTTFESTASFSSSFYNSSSTSAPRNNTSPTPNLNQLTSPSPTAGPLNPDNNNTNNKNNGFKIDKRVLSILLTIFFVTFTIFLVIYINSRRRKSKIRKILKSDPKNGIMAFYEYLQKHLSDQGVNIKAGETLYEYSQRLDRYGQFYPHKIEDISHILVKARYSLEEITPQEKEAVNNFLPKILSSTQKKMGRFRYFLWTYILGKV